MERERDEIKIDQTAIKNKIRHRFMEVITTVNDGNNQDGGEKAAFQKIIRFAYAEPASNDDFIEIKKILHIEDNPISNIGLLQNLIGFVLERDETITPEKGNYYGNKASNNDELIVVQKMNSGDIVHKISIGKLLGTNTIADFLKIQNTSENENKEKEAKTKYEICKILHGNIKDLSSNDPKTIEAAKKNISEILKYIENNSKIIPESLRTLSEVGNLKSLVSSVVNDKNTITRTFEGNDNNYYQYQVANHKSLLSINLYQANDRLTTPTAVHGGSVSLNLETFRAENQNLFKTQITTPGFDNFIDKSEGKNNPQNIETSSDFGKVKARLQQILSEKELSKKWAEPTPTGKGLTYVSTNNKHAFHVEPMQSGGTKFTFPANKDLDVATATIALNACGSDTITLNGTNKDRLEIILKANSVLNPQKAVKLSDDTYAFLNQKTKTLSAFAWNERKFLKEAFQNEKNSREGTGVSEKKTPKR